MRRMRRQEAEAEVNIAPLIDMVFILLIFFMVSTTFVKDMKLDIQRPSAASAQRASTKALRVHIERDGAIYVDRSPVKAWMLQSRIRELLRGSASGQVLVITDRQVPAEKLVDVVDKCRLAGAKDVAVATEEEAG